jgi:hypothetical protein
MPLLKLRFMAPADRAESDSVMLTLSVAVTVSAKPVSEPVPVQPVTVKVWKLPVSVSWAFVTPLKLNVVLGAVNWLLLKVKLPLAESTTVVNPGPTSEPVPLQALMLKV